MRRLITLICSPLLGVAVVLYIILDTIFPMEQEEGFDSHLFLRGEDV